MLLSLLNASGPAFPHPPLSLSLSLADMAAAESLLKSGEVSAMIRQGFISSPTSSAAGARLSPKFSSPSSSPPSLSAAAAAAAMHPSPPSSSLPSPKASTLFEMISQEDLSRRVPPPPPSSSEQKRRRLEERISKVLSTEGTRWGPADVELSVSSGDGFRFSMAVHRRVLASRSRFFAEKLEGIVGTLGSPVVVEICECDDVEVYVEAVAMMYCRDLRLSVKEVGMVLGLLKVSMDIMFDAGVRACLDYLEVVPWSEDEEEKVVSVLSQLQLHELPNGILQRVSVEPSTSSSADTIFFRVLAGVLQAKDEKARREMKALLSGLLREGKDQSKHYGNKIDVSRETLYHLCKKCLNSLHMCLSEAANADEGRRDRGTIMAEIAREADNIQWLVEILINKRMCDEFVTLWADETELASCHSKIPCMYRYEISRITAQLCIAIGKGHLLVSKDARISLLRTWLEALYEDFGWMKRACRIFDKKMVEDGLCQTILTLPMAQQQTILLRWFDCFLNKGDDCPNMQRAFEVWWRRAFVRQYAGNQDLSGLQIAV